MSDTECPTCQRTFKNRHGLLTHDSMVHDGELSVSWRECEGCGEEFRPPPSRKDGKHCSMECRKRRVELECGFCGSTFERRPSKSYRKFCSRGCAGRSRRSRLKKTCEQCGSDFECTREIRRFCSQGCHGEWQAEHRAGENHPSWKGGVDDYYGPGWRIQRQKARQRDGHACQRCGRHADDLGQEPDVHHIRPFRLFDDSREANRLGNLVCLCRSCHMVWEGIPLRPTPAD